MKYFFSITLSLRSIFALASFDLSGHVNGIHQLQTILVNVPFDCWYYQQLTKEVATNANGYFNIRVDISKAQNIFVEYNGKRILIYAEPNKNLELIFDSADFQRTLHFQGKLKTENEFRKKIGLTFFSLYPQNWNDSSASPTAITNAIKRNQMEALQKLAALKITSSSSFQTITKGDIDYFLPVKIWGIIYSSRDPLKTNKLQWQQALRDAYAQKPLSNDEVISSFYYQNMITYYARYLNTSAGSPEEFEKTVERIFKQPFTEVSAEIKLKGKRYFEYRAINNVLKGKALEHALAAFIYNGIVQGNLNYLQEAYSDFLFRFPNSNYRAATDNIIEPYLASQSSGGEKNLILEPVDYLYSSLGEVLKKHLGHVVYIDLWGSWCGPCRDEFSYNKPLKVYFSGKPVDFLYIAFEHDRGKPEVIWRKTVQFYNLTGRHVLADSLLKNDIEKLYHPNGITGFPSYILVDKKGVIKNLVAGRPSSKELLYNQIEQLLK